MSWRDLPAGKLNASADIPGIDAQLVWADATAWRDFRRPVDCVPVVVELKPDSEGARGLAVEVKDARGRMADCYGDPATTHCTADLTSEHLSKILEASGSHPSIRRLELSRPLVPLRPRPEAKPPVASTATPAERVEMVRSASGATVFGVIDSGCPFAHLDLRRRGTMSTRIAQLWIQDDSRALEASGCGAIPLDFGYGVEFSRAGLDKIMAEHASDGTVDEAACYEAAGMSGLRRRYQHGAAVLGLLAGPMPLASRVALAQGDSPSWMFVGDEAASADIVFVQLPSDAVQDSTSAGLARYLLDGLYYILSCATAKTKRIVVNVSDGSSRGSHDGNSIVECAMRSLVEAEFRRGRVLEIVVAAGNSFDEERHAQFDGLADGRWHSVNLRLPPDNEMPTQVVVAVPADSDVELRVVSPSGRECVVRSGEAKGWFVDEQAAAAMVFPRAEAARSVEALITFAPTTRFATTDPCAPFGDWRIAVRSPGRRAAPVHLFVTRNQNNAGALARGRQARFVDKSKRGVYDPLRHRRALEYDPTFPESPIRRRGSLNSLATSPAGRGILVAGSRFVNDPAPAPYSSTGPAIGSGARRVPDFLAPTEQSRGSPGIISAGVLSGQRVRVHGTSFAAPQVARERGDRGINRQPLFDFLLRREGGRVRKWFA